MVLQAQAGDHNNPATWVGGIIPVAPETVTVLYNLNIVADWDIGHSPATSDATAAFLLDSATATVTFSTGVKLTHRGDVKIAVGNIVMGAGSSFYGDTSLAINPTAQSYGVFLAPLGGDARYYMQFIANGTNANRCRIHSNIATGGRGFINSQNGIGVFDLNYLTMSEMNGNVALGKGYITFNVQHCIFENITSLMYWTVENLACTVKYNIFRDFIDDTALIVENDFNTVAIQDFSNNIFESRLLARTLNGIKFDNCILQRSAVSRGTSNSLKNIIFTRRNFESSSNGFPSCTIEDPLFYFTHALTGGHSEGVIAPNGSTIISGGIAESDTQTEEWNEIIGPDIEGTPTVDHHPKVKGLVVGLNAAGKTFCQLSMIKGTKYSHLEIENVTFPLVSLSAYGRGGLFVSGTDAVSKGHKHAINSFRNNLLWNCYGTNVNTEMPDYSNGLYYSGTAQAGSTSSVVLTDFNLPNPVEQQGLDGDFRVKITSGLDSGLSRLATTTTTGSFIFATPFPNSTEGQTYIAYACDILNQDQTGYNAWCGASANTTIYDQDRVVYNAEATGYSRFVSSEPEKIGDNDIIMSRESLIFSDINRNIGTFATRYLSIATAPAWVNGTSYSVGSVVSKTDPLFYNNYPINFVCIQATSSVNPGVVSADWREHWELQSYTEIKKNIIQETGYNTDATQANFVAWAREGWAPTTQTLKAAGYDGSDIGAVPVATVGTTHTVTYNGNGNDSGTVPIDTNEYAENEEFTVLGNTGNLAKIGHTIGDWNTMLDGSGFSWGEGDIIEMPAADVELFAQWTVDSHDVIFNSNGGSGTIANQSIDYGTAENLTVNSFTRTGHAFNSWNTAANGSGTAYANQASFTMGLTNVTLYAQWAVNTYYVLFDANTGVGSVANQGINYGASANLTANTFTKLGFNFGNWNTAANGSGTTYANQASFTMANAINANLYAQWAIANYTITYILNGGTNSNLNPSTYNINTPTITFAPPTKTGYLFLGWSISTIPQGTTGNITTTATWAPVVYEITYNLRGGINNPLNPENYTIDSDLITFLPPTKIGVIFIEWSRPTIQHGTTGNISTTARWDEPSTDTKLTPNTLRNSIKLSM